MDKQEVAKMLVDISIDYMNSPRTTGLSAGHLGECISKQVQEDEELAELFDAQLKVGVLKFLEETVGIQTA